MERMIALLRGINVGGKNKITMSELKSWFEELGFIEVRTYLNSGNVVFSSAIADRGVLSKQINAMIADKSGLSIPTFVISQHALRELLQNAPDWWGDTNADIYDNIIFMLPPLTCDALYAEIGSPHPAYEKAWHCGDAVFWSFCRKDYQKTNWWSKTATSGVRDSITIRTANTLRRVADMG